MPTNDPVADAFNEAISQSRVPVTTIKKPRAPKLFAPIDYTPKSKTAGLMDELGISHGSLASGPANISKFYGTLGKDLFYEPAKFIGQTLGDPEGKLEEIRGSHQQMFDEAAENFQHGETLKGIGHHVAGSIPLIGPMAGGIADKIGTPETIEGVADATAAILPLSKTGREVIRRMTAPELRRSMARRIESSTTGTDRVGEYGSRPTDASLDNTGIAASSEGKLSQIKSAKQKILANVRRTLSSPAVAGRVSDITDRINTAANQVKSYVTNKSALRELEALRQKAITQAQSMTPDKSTVMTPEGVLNMRQWADGGITGEFGGNSASVSKKFFQHLRGQLKEHLNNVAPEVADLNNQAHSLIDAEEQATSKFNAEGKSPVVDTSSVPNTLKSIIPAKTLAKTTAAKLLSIGTKEPRVIPKPNVPLMIKGNHGAFDARSMKVPKAPVTGGGKYSPPHQGVPSADFAGSDAGNVYDVRGSAPGHVPASLPFESGPTAPVPGSFNSGQPTPFVSGLLEAGDPASGGFRQGDKFTSYPEGQITTPGVKYDPRIAESGSTNNSFSAHSSLDNSPVSQNIPTQPPGAVTNLQQPPQLAQVPTLQMRPTRLSKSPAIQSREVSPLGTSTQAGGYGLGSRAVEPTPYQPSISGRFGAPSAHSSLGEAVTISVDNKPVVAKVSSITKSANGLVKVRVTYPDKFGVSFETFEFKNK
jgi:hypothetical protein